MRFGPGPVLEWIINWKGIKGILGDHGRLWKMIWRRRLLRAAYQMLACLAITYREYDATALTTDASAA